MGGARVTTLVTLRKCTLGNKREIKSLKFVSASTKGFKGGLAWIKPSKKDMAVTFSYWGRVALLLLSRAGGGTIPPASGGGRRGPRGLRGRWGGWGGGSRRGLPAPLLGGGLRYSILAPLVSSAHSLPACACRWGRGAAPGWGGMRNGPWTAPPGAPADLNPPSALP